MKKRGFTLIELLAVILILGIIALIAIPIITNLVREAKKKSLVSTAYGLLKAADYKVSLNDNQNIYNFSFPNSKSELGYNGTTPSYGYIYIANGKSSIAIYDENSKTCAYKDYDSDIVYTKEVEHSYNCSAVKNITRAVWFWNNEAEFHHINNQSERTVIFDALQDMDINTFYLTVNSSLGMDNYKPIIKDATSRGIKVYALYGDPRFIVNMNNSVTNVIDTISTYNSSAADDEKFAGIHYDVEWYTLRDTPLDGEGGVYTFIDGNSEAAKNNIRRRKYIEFAKNAYEYGHSKKLEISYDIPCYLDRYQYFEEGSTETKSMFDELIKYADSVAFMDYTTNSTNMYNSLVETFESGYQFSGDTSEEKVYITQNKIDKLNSAKVNYVVGFDVNTYKAEYDTKLTRPDLVESGVIDANYAFTEKYIYNEILLKLDNMILENNKTNNYINNHYGYAVHHIGTLLSLTGVMDNYSE